MVAVAATAGSKTLAGGRIARRFPRRGCFVAAAGENWIGCVLAVVGSLFALFISAYSMRMELIDWRALPVPKLLRFNTGVLIVSSAALQWAQIAVRRNDSDNVLIGLLAGGVSASFS